MILVPNKLDDQQIKLYLHNIHKNNDITSEIALTELIYITEIKYAITTN